MIGQQSGARIFVEANRTMYRTKANINITLQAQIKDSLLSRQTDLKIQFNVVDLVHYNARTYLEDCLK